jgi:hypothetical protein
MSQHAPSTVSEWREFFRESAARLAPEAVEVGSPATAEAIAAAEARLGVRLPPGYRNFLLVTDGWSDVVHHKVEELLGVAGIGWLPEVEPELWDAWWPEVLDDEEGALLKRCLLVSGNGNGDSWLLSADDVAENGEWTAYEWWAGDTGDLVPHESFAALVVSARDEYVAKFGPRPSDG